MGKIIRYSFSELVRSTWSLVYFAFYVIIGFALLYLNNDIVKSVLTLMNIIVVLTPMIAIIIGVMFYYNSREFTELLLAQPIQRKTLFLGQYYGLCFSLSLSLVLGLGIPFIIYGAFASGQLLPFISLLITGVFLNFIFAGIAFLIGLLNDNRIKGFSYAILVWIFFAILYDGLFLIALIIFKDYPLDYFALVAVILNPIDLSRTLILLEIDAPALLGYTAAVFKTFFGTPKGMIISLISLMLWTMLPIIMIPRIAQKKDF